MGINGACDLSEAGLECQYGTQTCCGEEYAVFLVQCTGSQWATIAVETPCMFAGATCAPSPTVCPTIYEPVCGANDVTYSNNFKLLVPMWRFLARESVPAQI